METIQINGQKIWGPPKGWVGPPPPHGTEVFIKNIPEDVFEAELYHLFSFVGMVYEVRLPVHWTGINKGYAFVRYSNITEADAAIDKLNLWTIRQGRQIRVERSFDNTRLFLSSVPNDKTGDEIKSDLLSIVDNVKTVYVYSASENPATFRGYAFVEFVCHRDAAIAKRALTPDILFNLFGKKCIAAWANPLPFLNNETLQKINILFMRNIPSHTKSISIRLAVDSVISPDSVHKVKRLNDYAFLTFKNHEMAERAMMKIKWDPYLLGEKAVHVEWAIPRELAGRFSSKELEKDDASEVDFEPNAGHCPPLLRMLRGQKNPIEDYINVNNININNGENIPFGYQLNPGSIRILQRDPSKVVAEAKQIQHEQNTNTPLMTVDQIFHNYNRKDQNVIAEFLHSDSKDYYRDMHLKNWLQSLSLSDQYTSCATSPTLTSPSTDSSTNVSWKWDESSCQFSTGSGTSSGCAKPITKTSQQFCLF